MQWPPVWWVRRHCEHAETKKDDTMRSDGDGMIYHEVICQNPKCRAVVYTVLDDICAGADIIL